jgi:hypothetical protein
MARRRIQRDSATPKGFKRRIADLELEKVNDPRDSRWVEIPSCAKTRPMWSVPRDTAGRAMMAGAYGEDPVGARLPGHPGSATR